MTQADADGLPLTVGGGRRRLIGATAGMAVGTTVSRVTGLFRVIALAWALGSLGFADAYNLANTTPNIIVDLVLTGVLSATFVPVFVDYLSTRRAKDAWEAISAVSTVTVVVTVIATVAFFILAPDIVHLYTQTNHNADVHHQQEVAITLLRWFVPQLTCYALIALFTALLNARGKFAAPMFVPIANNLVVIVVLVWFHLLVPHPSLASIAANHRGLVLLGAGTTLGVVVQAALLVPSLARARLHVHFLWQPGHAAMRTITRLGGWTFGWVVASQIALFVILALADGVSPGAVSAYTYSYQFFLLPYGIVTVSIMSAVTPTLSARWARRDTAGFRHRMAYGLRGMLAIIIPSAVGMLILAHPLIDLILAHGTTTAADAQLTGSALAMLSLGLPGFCTFLYMVRVFQSMQDTKTAFRLYLVENGINVVVAVALVRPLGVRGLTLSISVAYTVAAVLALSVVRQRVGGLGGDDLTTPVKRVVGASAVMAVVTIVVVNVSGATSGFALFARVVLAVVVGVAAYAATAAFLGARHARRRASGKAPGVVGGTAPPHPSDPEGPPPHPSDPDPGAGTPGITAPAAGRGVASDPSHDRLGLKRRGSAYRHLRPIDPPPEDGAGSTAARRTRDEEDLDGPHTGGNR